MRPSTRLPCVLLGALLVAGCTSSPSSPEEGEQATVGRVSTTQPGAATTLVADADPVASAASASRALFGSSLVAVVAGADDPAGQLLGASAAVGLGVPLLLAPAAGGDVAALDDELGRLGVESVLAVGGAEVPGAREVVAVAADAGAVDEATGLSLGDADPVAADAQVAAVAGLDPEDPVALLPAEAVAAEEAGEGGELPEVERGEPLEGTVVLTDGGAETLAGAATARAAGADVVVTPGVADPRASAELVDRFSTDRPDAVVALGAGYGAQAGLDWKLATAASGTQLPGGGQLLFPEHTLIALYGVPGSGALGVLGEQDLPATVQRARDTAAPYEALVDSTVVPTFEIIVTVASDSPGPDGNYSTELDVEDVRPYVEAAGEAGMYVVLDLQPGRSDFLSQAQQYRSLLELPHVGLALDPEWRLTPTQRPLQQIGSVGIDEVNQVVTWLADLTREQALPQKLLVLHQFQVRMIADRERLDTSRDELAYLVHVDGQGSQPAKQDTWRVLRQGAPPEMRWGWKNFYDEDEPVLTPEQTIAQVMPRPELVTYQ